MKIFEQSNLNAMLSSIGITIKGMIANPAFLLISSSFVGVIQIFLYRHDLTSLLLVATIMGFLLTTVLGVSKHFKSGEAKGEIFIKKTVEQFVVMVSVIMLGYIASMFIGVFFKIATQVLQSVQVVQSVPGTDAIPVPGAALYFIFVGYAIMFTYYFIKCCDLIDQIAPNLLPPWFSAPFRKFRNSGDYKDLLTFGGDEKPEEPK